MITSLLETWDSHNNNSNSSNISNSTSNLSSCNNDDSSSSNNNNIVELCDPYLHMEGGRLMRRFSSFPSFAPSFPSFCMFPHNNVVEVKCMHKFLKTTIPVELWYYIASFFDAKTLIAVSMLSKAWLSIAQDDTLWKYLCVRRFDITAFHSQSAPKSWKEFYLTHKIYGGTWDVTNMGKMLLSKNFKTATHGGDFLGSYQCVRGNAAITVGVCYWEILIDKLNSHQTGFHVVVGVVPASFNYRHTYLTSNGGWGYLADGRKAHNSGNGEQYGQKYIQGDKVGVLVDLYRKRIIFYLNGVSQGVAFEGVVGPVYPAVSLLTGGQRATLLENTSFPVEYVTEVEH